MKEIPFFASMGKQFSLIETEIQENRKLVEEQDEEKIKLAHFNDQEWDSAHMELDNLEDFVNDKKKGASELGEQTFYLQGMLKYFQDKRESLGDFAIKEMLSSRK